MNWEKKKKKGQETQIQILPRMLHWPSLNFLSAGTLSKMTMLNFCKKKSISGLCSKLEELTSTSIFLFLEQMLETPTQGKTS